jgi:hypothetical protein
LVILIVNESKLLKRTQKNLKSANSLSEEREARIRELSKKLFKFKDDKCIIDLDPFEMHRKIRLYQSKLELSEIHNVKVEEKLKEIDSVFQILGLTLQDLKKS